MVQVKYNSAGVSATDAGTVLAPPAQGLSTTPAAVIGTAARGPAFVPVSFINIVDFSDRFGDAYITGSRIIPQDRFTTYGPLAIQEWFRNASSGIFLRVLGAGDGKQRIQSGSKTGEITNAGFTVGEEQPNHSTLSGTLSFNPYANLNGIPGRTYFLGCFMSESAGSTIFSSAGLQGTGSLNAITSSAVPIIRGVLMAPSGVILRLSSSGGTYDSSAPSSTLVANDQTAKGTTLGSVKLFDVDNDTIQLQEFVLLLNGHKGTTDHPNVITASFDMQSSNYITKVFNLTASLMQDAGHYLAAYWDIHPTTATLTGTGVVKNGADVVNTADRAYSTERSAFIITSSLSRDTGNQTTPNYESFRDRFSNASTPWIISQKFHGKPINLFKLHALDSGADVSNKYKFIIDNITPADINSPYPYGTFDLTIRQIEDFLETSIPLEKHVNLTLDPSSPTYISKVIGDRHAYFDFDRPVVEQKLIVEGNYVNLSRYVRVEVSNDVNSGEMPAKALPVGFRGMAHLVTSGSAPLASLNNTDASALVNSTFLRNIVEPPIPMADNINVYNQDNATFFASPTKHWGIKLDHVTDLSQQNRGILFNRSIDSFAKHFPNHSTVNINFSVSDNQGVEDTTTNGILDADRFCNNIFTLENIKVLTGSNNVISPEDWAHARYVRNGIIGPNDAEKTRRLSIKDFSKNNNKAYLSFQFMLQGGFDGVNVFEKNEYNLSNIAAYADMYDANRGRLSGPTVAAYRAALNILSDAATVDMQLLAIPGIREPAITDYATDVAESRFDSLYIMDIEQLTSDGTLIDISSPQAYTNSLLPDVQSTIDRFTYRYIKSSFASAYFPDVTLSVDPTIYTVNSVQVPPSTVVLGALALNNAIGQPWFAPAGNNRGALKTTISTTVKLNEQQRNSLYSGSINPIYAPGNTTGQGSGVIIWGQKTLGSLGSLLSRINIRRLLLEIRRDARDIATQLLFETGKDNVIAVFNSRMDNRLRNIQTLMGLRDYRIQIDASSTTQSDIENSAIRGKIYIQPFATDEFVVVDLNVSANGNSEV